MQQRAEIMYFMGVAIRPGDIIGLSPIPGKSLIPEGVSVACVRFDNNGKLIVFVPEHLAYITTRGKRMLTLTPDFLHSVWKIMPGYQVVQQETNGRLSLFDRVQFKVDRRHSIGTVIAALEGVLIVRCDDSQSSIDCIGEARHFTKVICNDAGDNRPEVWVQDSIS